MVVRFGIWYHLHNLKNVKNIHGAVLILVKLQAATLLKLTFLHGSVSRFLSCTNGTKSRDASQWPNLSIRSTTFLLQVKLLTAMSNCKCFDGSFRPNVTAKIASSLIG